MANKLTPTQIKEIINQYKLINKSSLKKREYSIFGYSIRDDYQRDYARILYSPSFRRLQGKMQINGIKSNAFYRNRLTHSLEVAQIATSIAYKLSSLCSSPNMYKDDIFVLEAAALAHDIGHPAFGHKGERILDEIAKKYNMRFEGNAQNFRILRKLERKDPKYDGLNLSNRTLLAINKYIVKENNGVNKFMYEDDYNYLAKVRGKQLEQRRTLDVQIIELADDIAYAVHDLEDGLHLRKFNIDEILYILKQKDPKKLFNPLNYIVTYAKKYCNEDKDNVYNVQKYSKLFRMRLTSKLIDTFVNDITIEKVDKDFALEHGVSEDHPELTLKDYKYLLTELKKAVFYCSTRDSNIQEYERKGEIIIKSLFNFYTDLTKNNDAKLLPPDFRPIELQKRKKEQNKYTVKRQLIQNSIDYISGMMDTYAISEYERLFNVKFEDINLNQNIDINPTIAD